MESANHFGGVQWRDELAISDSNDRAEKRVAPSFSHCKVFRESEEVGRTVDLALFTTYDELCARLAFMFGMDKMELQRNLVYTGKEGSTLHAGVEPYRTFMKTVRRLKILSDSSSAAMDSIAAPAPSF